MQIAVQSLFLEESFASISTNPNNIQHPTLTYIIGGGESGFLSRYNSSNGTYSKGWYGIPKKGQTRVIKATVPLKWHTEKVVLNGKH